MTLFEQLRAKIKSLDGEFQLKDVLLLDESFSSRRALIGSYLYKLEALGEIELLSRRNTGVNRRYRLKISDWSI